MDYRGFKRYHYEVPIHIRGLDAQGKLLEEETRTLNLSARSAYFVSTKDYDKRQILSVTLHLSYPLGEDVETGDWTVEARILRIENREETEDGKLIRQNLAIRFVSLPGADPEENPWADRVD